MKTEDGRTFITIRGTGHAFYDFDAADFAEAVRKVIGGDVAEVRRLRGEGAAPESWSDEDMMWALDDGHRTEAEAESMLAARRKKKNEQAPEAPPVEDNLARAREKYDESVTYVSMLEAAIRERDEKAARIEKRYDKYVEKEAACCPDGASFDGYIAFLKDQLEQMMTVEEADRWWFEWSAIKDEISHIDYLRRRIKERNDADKAGK